MGALGTDHYSALGQALTLRVRPTYYDPLDSAAGHVGNSSLVMGDTQFELRHGRSFVSRIDIVGIDSANPGLTGLPGDSGRAWKLHVGAEEARLFCADCLVGRLQGDMGYGRKWAPSIYSAAYVGVALQNARAGQGLGFARVAADLIWGSGERVAAKLAYEQRLPLLARTGGYAVAGIEARWAISSQSDLRLTYRHDGTSVAGIGVGAYW